MLVTAGCSTPFVETARFEKSLSDLHHIAVEDEAGVGGRLVRKAAEGLRNGGRSLGAAASQHTRGDAQNRECEAGVECA